MILGAAPIASVAISQANQTSPSNNYIIIVSNPAFSTPVLVSINASIIPFRIN